MPQSKTCSHIPLRSADLPINGLYPRNPCDYTEYYSFTDPRGTEGWVDLVGWPIADTLPTMWLLVNRRSGTGQGESASQRPTPTTHQSIHLMVLISCVCICVLPAWRNKRYENQSKWQWRLNPISWTYHLSMSISIAHSPSRASTAASSISSVNPWHTSCSRLEQTSVWFSEILASAAGKQNGLHIIAAEFASLDRLL